MIFRQGDPASYFYVIRHGHVAIELPSAHGGAITIQTLSEGDVLGWSWLMEPYRYRFDARAVMLTRVLSFDGVCLRKKCEEDATLGYHLFKRFSGAIAQRLEATRLQLLDLYGAPEGVRG
jgi:CRP-like cAMP-binding protein